MTIKRTLSLLFCLILALTLCSSLPALAAEKESKVVRVGWYESPFNMLDQFGRRNGYAYEYQQRIAAYTNWTYEYVEGTWPNLLAMVQSGEIDLMSDVSYTAERAGTMLYSALPMGAEEYYAFIAPDNTEITAENPASFNGKKVGVNKDSVQEAFFREWAEIHGVQAEIVELDDSQSAYIEMLDRGDIDVLVTLDAYGDVRTAIPICKIGASDFYFTVNPERQDLLAELDTAMSRIQDEDRFYNRELYEKYIKTSGANLFLSTDEKNWLEDHGAIRVGYLNSYLAFCSADMQTMTLTGALKDYLEDASTCLENAELSFATRAFSSIEAALNALINGEIDCVFPVCLSSYDSEKMGLIITTEVMRTEMYAAVRTAEQKTFSLRGDVTVAINKGNLNYETFLMDRFPNWTFVFLEDLDACFEAVGNKEADCVLLSNYQINSTANACRRNQLSTLSTGEALSFSFAVRRGEAEIYSILNKVIGLVPASMVNSSLSFYSSQDITFSFADFLTDNIIGVLITAILLMVLIVWLLMWNIKTGRKAGETRQLISAVELDDLTRLYNKNFFFEYANQLYQDPSRPRMDAVVLNIEQFHTINELRGRQFGDHLLRLLGEEINAFLGANEGIGGRTEADRFVIYCVPQNDYQVLLNRLQRRVVSQMISQNFPIRVRMGVKPWQSGMEPAQLFERALTACDMVKGNEKRLKIYDEELSVQEDLNKRLVTDLDRAMEEREFRVYFQPKFDIQSDPPRLTSAEALIRWQHPELGMIAPIDFIPLFEKNGQIIEIDRYVLTETARQIASWREQYGVTIPVSVNLSRVDLMNAMLEQTLDDLTGKYGLDRKVLRLEVTESAYVQNTEAAGQLLNRLREKGYAIQMDDFGKGYSSLNMLSSMHVDALKMDTAFIQNIETNEKDARLVELILELAKNLHVPVEAKGVETESQMKRLKEIGCALVQGYFFSRPLPPEEFEKLIIVEQNNQETRQQGEKN